MNHLTLSLKQSETLSIPLSVSATTPIEPKTGKDIMEYNDDYTAYRLDDYAKYTPFIDLNVLKKHGYQMVGKIQTCLQGQIIKAIQIKSETDCKTAPPQYVAIKITNKKLHRLGIGKEADGENVCVHESILKERDILKYLTMNHKEQIGHYIAHYIDFFECDHNYYLVEEYIDGITLQEFVKTAHKYIKSRTLSLKLYKSLIRFISWQIAALIHNLHSLGVVHLDLADFTNIMVTNGAFRVNAKTGQMTMNPNLTIKLIDFGNSERYIDTDTNTNKVECDKWSLFGNAQYHSPQRFNEQFYDPFKNDVWCIGILLFVLSTGRAPYSVANAMIDMGYYSVVNAKLEYYCFNHKLSKFVGPKLIALILGCLTVNENKRFTALEILQSAWLKSYYEKFRDSLYLKE